VVLDDRIVPGDIERDVANMELAKLLETRGDYANASEAAYSFNNGGDMSYHSTMVREGARLADLGDDVGQALVWYRKFLDLFVAANPRFSDLLESMRARVAELETQLAER